MRPVGSRAHVVILCWVLAGALALAGGLKTASAAPLEGIYEIKFAGNESIWPLPDLSDCESQVIDGLDVELCVGLSFQRDGKGGVDGSGTFDFSANGIGVNIEGNLAGNLKGAIKGSDRSGYKQSVALKFKGTVSVDGAGGNLNAGMTGSLKTSITPAGIVETKGSLKVKVKNGGVTKSKLATGLKQLEEGSGEWTLKLNIIASADQTKLSGTAELMLPDGSRFIPLEGVYKPKSDKAQLAAKGKSANKGMQIDLKKLSSSEPGLFERGNARYNVQGFSGGRSLKD